jgi:colanic acid biosynthesis glycosyl transferase WcaI
MSNTLHATANGNRMSGPPGIQRLVFVNRFFYPDSSATSQILSDLAFAMAERGFDIHVVASRRRRVDELALPAKEIVRGVSVHLTVIPDLAQLGLVGRAIEYAAFYPSAAVALLRHVRRGDIVVAKTDPPMIAVVADLVSRLRGAKLVNWIQDLYPEVAIRLGVPLVRGRIGVLLEKIRDAILKNAAANVAIGERMAEFIVARGVAGHKIRVIPNWTDDEAIAPVPATQNPLRLCLGLENAFIVGYSGNLGRVHEFETVLGAADLLRCETHLVFLVIGRGVYIDALRERVHAQGLDDSFRFLPVQSRSSLKYSLSLPDVHWLSLRPDLEGLIVPSKFYGIAAAGRPVISITAKDGEIARLVKNAYCGVVIEPGVSSELASCIMLLRNDRAICEVMGKNARALIDERFSTKQALATWSELLENL